MVNLPVLESILKILSVALVFGSVQALPFWVTVKAQDENLQNLWEVD